MITDEAEKGKTGDLVVGQPPPQDEDGSAPSAAARPKIKQRMAIIIVVGLIMIIVVAIAVSLSNRGNNSSDDTTNAAAAADAAQNADDDTRSPSPAPTTNLRGSPATTLTATTPQVEFYETNMDQLMSFLADPEFMDKEFYMVNIVGYRDQAVYKDRRETNLTGFEANQIYAGYVLPQLQQIGASIVFQASIQWNMGKETPFTEATIVLYPNTTAFQQMISNPDFAANVVHKEAGLGANFVMACEKLDMPYIPPLENPPYPASETNLETAMININDYREKALYQEGDADADNNRTGREAYDIYSNNAGSIVLPYGVRNLATFNVKAVVTGEIGYEHIRVNWFPSDEAFNRVIANPERQSYSHHRYAGIEEKSKSFKVMPITLNRFFRDDDGDADNSETTCNICGDNGVISNPTAVVDVPGSESIECSQLEFAANAGLIPAEQCAVISSLVSGPCGCGNSPPDPAQPMCVLCEGSTVADANAVVELPTGDTASCGQLEFAAQGGLLPAEGCSVIAVLVSNTCGCT